jgi:glycosyltransferase involved in cell wall biosynthesis
MLAPEFSIGIVIPVYNKAPLLRETLLSLVSQTLEDFKVVVVDDGSTDDIAEIVDEFELDDRFIFIKNHKNLGESYSVNRGWAFLDTKYVAILSADDPQVNDWLEVVCKFALSNKGFVTYYPDLKIIDDDSLEIETIKLPVWKVQLIREKLICVASAGAVHDKSMFPEGFMPRDSRVIYPSDLIQYLNFSLHGDGIKVPGVYGIWRKSLSGLTSQLTGQMKATELNHAIRNWFSDNLIIQNEVNMARMEANLIGQTWKLYRHDETTFNSLKSMFRTFQFGWFLSIKNLFELSIAILERLSNINSLRRDT